MSDTEKTAFEIGFEHGMAKTAGDDGKISSGKKALIGGTIAAGGAAAGLSGLGYAMGDGASPMGGIRAIRYAHDLAMEAGKDPYILDAGGKVGNYASRLGRAFKLIRGAATRWETAYPGLTGPLS